MNLLVRWALNTLALLIVVKVVPHFYYRSLFTLAIAALILGLLNAVLRPFIVVLTLPITVVTFGLFLIIVNAIMLELTAMFVPGFHIDSFFWAVIGSIVLSLVSWVTNRLGKKREE
jgi:putative membrane protein